MGSAPTTSEPMSTRSKVTAGLATVALLAAGSGTVMAGLPEGGVVTCTPAEFKPLEPKTVADEAPKAVITDGSVEASVATNCGTLELELFANKAPQSVAALRLLSEKDFYNKTGCPQLHVGSSVGLLLCGSRTLTQFNNPGFTWGPVENTPESGVFPAGSVIMFRGQKEDSHTGDLMIAFKDSVLPPQETREFTLVGKVTKGMPILNHIADGGVRQGSRAPIPNKVLIWESFDVK